MDAADGHHRDGNTGAHIRQHLTGDHVGVRLGVGGKHGPAAQIVGPVRKSLFGLRHIVGRHADDLVRAQQAAGLGGAQVVLPHMYAVRTAQLCQRDIVIEDERDMVRSAEGGNCFCLGQHIGVVQVFFPQLNAGGSAFQGGFHLLGQGLSADPGAVRHGIKPQHLSGTVHNTAPLAKFRSGWPAWSAARPNAAG